MSSISREVQLNYQVPRWSPDWAVPEVPVPESLTHDAAIEYIRALLRCWAEREGLNFVVARNLGIRWYSEDPRVGFDPDLCLVTPPAGEPELGSLRLWETGHKCGKAMKADPCAEPTLVTVRRFLRQSTPGYIP